MNRANRLEEGLLWFDNSKNSLVGKVLQAAKHYEKKHGQRPNRCFVNPANFEPIPLDMTKGVKVSPAGTVLRDHFLLGVINEEKTDLQPRQIEMFAAEE